MLLGNGDGLIVTVGVLVGWTEGVAVGIVVGVHTGLCVGAIDGFRVGLGTGAAFPQSLMAIVKIVINNKKWYFILVLKHKICFGASF